MGLNLAKANLYACTRFNLSAPPVRTKVDIIPRVQDTQGSNYVLRKKPHGLKRCLKPFDETQTDFD